jgi:hypothetical protein
MRVDRKQAFLPNELAAWESLPVKGAFAMRLRP